MKRLYETLVIAESSDPREVPATADAAIVLDDAPVEKLSDLPLILYWAILPAPREDADNVSCRGAAWLARVGFLCEILESLLRRGSNVVLFGSASANLAAAHLLRNRQLPAAQVLPSFQSLEGFDPAGMAAVDGALPGRRLVHAERVKAPAMIAPTGSLFVSPPAGPPLGNNPIGYSQAPLTVSPAGMGPQTPPPPQSGMQFAPQVGAQPGQAQSVPSTAQDRAIDAALARLPGHRSSLVGTVGPRPTPPPEEQLISVFDLAARQQAAGSQDRVINASDGAVAVSEVSGPPDTNP